MPVEVSYGVQVSVKLSVFNQARRNEGVWGSGGEWSASCLGRFTPRERAPDTHWIGGWVGHRAGLDAVAKR